MTWILTKSLSETGAIIFLPTLAETGTLHCLTTLIEVFVHILNKTHYCSLFVVIGFQFYIPGDLKNSLFFLLAVFYIAQSEGWTESECAFV